MAPISKTPHGVPRNLGVNKFLTELNRLIPVRLKGRPRDMERHLAIQLEHGISMGLIVDPKWYKSDRQLCLEFCVSGTGEFLEWPIDEYIRYGTKDYSWIMRGKWWWKNKKPTKVLTLFNLGSQMAHKAVRYHEHLQEWYPADAARDRYQLLLRKRQQAVKAVQQQERDTLLAKSRYREQQTRVRYVIIQQLEDYQRWARPIMDHRAQHPSRPIDVDINEPDYRGQEFVFTIDDLIADR